jgi:hypothetical protein
MTLAVEDGQLVLDTDALDEFGFTFERVLEPVSLDNFELWITQDGERFPLEITLFPDETGQYVWFRSRIAVAKRDSLATAP